MQDSEIDASETVELKTCDNFKSLKMIIIGSDKKHIVLILRVRQNLPALMGMKSIY